MFFINVGLKLADVGVDIVGLDVGINGGLNVGIDAGIHVGLNFGITLGGCWFEC